jgi:hypothetical protein
VPLKADQPVGEIPIEEGDAPNAYVSVLIIKGSQDSAREHREPQPDSATAKLPSPIAATRST